MVGALDNFDHNLSSTPAQSSFHGTGMSILDDCPELLFLNTRNCAEEAVTDTIRNIKELGLSQYRDYCLNVITSRKVSIHQL